MNNKLRNTLCLLAALGFSLATSLQAAGKEHQFGPTGIFGNLSKTTIKVTKVDKGSPADGKITPGMQIIGAGSSNFETHVRRELADVIDIAETEQAGGKLTLLLKGDKKVDLKLEVLGTYSATAPYNCPKTEAILQRAAKYIGNKDRLHVSRLAALAINGKPKVEGQAEVRDPPGNERREKGPAKLLDNRLYCTWDWGYQLIAACEQYLLHKNKADLPHIRSLAVTLAQGQDAGGLYGHQLALPERNGRLPGYAQMNQPSLTCYMGLLLAQKCGVDDPELTEAIERTNAYVASFIGKGTFNYGVHGPNTRSFNNNGMSGTAALVMALKGNKEGAAFFSQLAAASYDELETGHATHYFNVMWTPLGVAVAGPEVTSEFFKKARWVYTMYRSWNGRMTLDGDTTKMNAPAALVLPFALGRRNLLITGRDADQSLWLKGQDAADVVALSQIDYKNRSADELIALFGSPIPQVTRRAVWTLREKEKEVDFIPQLVKMMQEGTKIQKQNAIGYFGYGCPKETALARLDDLGAILRDSKEDLEVRAAAAGALAMLGQPAHKYYGDMVKLVREDKPDDRFGDVDQALGKNINLLCKDPFQAGLVTDKQVFYQAALKLADHKRQHARADGLRMLAGMPLEDFHLVADKVMHVIEDKDPTYHSYHSPGGPVGAAIAVLANLNIEEGMPLALDIHDNPSGKHSFKMLACWAALAKYGANAKPALEQLKVRYEGRTNFGRHTRKWNAMVKAIEEDQNPRKLISLEEAKQAGL